MKLFNSLAFKNAALYLILFLVGLSLMGFLLLDSASSRIIKNAKDQLEHSGNQVEILLKEYLEELVIDLAFLSGNPVLKKYLESNRASFNELLSEEFLSLLSANNHYNQIRYIDAESGMELIRVDRLKNTPVITPLNELQNKQNRKYFIEAKSLNQGEYYFSPINLNREYGIISEPYLPTLRIAKPIFHRDHLDGIVVINTELSKLFDKLNNSVGADFDLRMLNDEGFYLLHEEQDSCFLFEFKNTHAQLPLKDLSNREKIINEKSALSYNNSVVMPQKQYKIFYQIVAKKSILLKPYFEWMKQSITRILMIAILFSLIAFLVLRHQFKNLQKLKTSIQEYPLKREASELPKNRNDEIGELANTFEEMTDLINTQIKDIETAKNKAEQAEKDKSEFIENITHEIRNPLQNILGLSSLLEKNSPQAHQIDILNSIKFNTSNLNGLINSILDYQNILKPNFSLDSQFIKIEDLIEKLIIGIRFTADQKNIGIVSFLDEGVKACKIYVDQLRLTQVLNNLLLNAISHTPINGRINIKVESRTVNKKTMEFIFCVEDNGIGITDSEIAKIQNRYFTNSRDNLVNPNHGLGLTIVNEILNLMDSKLDIQSQKGIGSKFSFTIRTGWRENINKDSRLNMFESSKSFKKILIIEDDPQVILMYKNYLEDAKLSFLEDLSVISQFENEEFDLIITDFFLKDSDFDTFHSKLIPWLTNDTPLLVISGHFESLNSVKNIYPNAYFLQKPVSKKDFIECIENINMFRKFGIPRLQIIKEDYDNNPIKYSKAINLLLDEWKKYTQRLSDSIRHEKLDAFKEINHKLNNTLRRIGLNKLEDFLLNLEIEMKESSIDHEVKAIEIESIMNHYFEYISEYAIHHS